MAFLPAFMIILVSVFSAVLVLTRPRGLVPGMGCVSIFLFTQSNRYLLRVCCVSGIAQHLGMANTVQNGSSLFLSSPSPVGKCRKKYTIKHKAVGFVSLRQRSTVRGQRGPRCMCATQVCEHTWSCWESLPEKQSCIKETKLLSGKG